MQSFDNWTDFTKFIKNTLDITPYSGVGIFYVKRKNTVLLRSVTETYYYDDDLTSVNFPLYTLYGQEGDQSCDEPRFNRNLFGAAHIYLYRVETRSKQKKYTWYGEFKIHSILESIHQDKHHNPRRIYRVQLESC